MMQTEKAKATAQRIADVAVQHFAANGYDGTTIGGVAAAAGVAPGTVMLHFGSKSQLATAAFADQIADVVRASSASAGGQSMADDLERFVRPLYSWYSEHRSFAPDLLREALFSHGPWSVHYEKTVASTIEALAKIVIRHDQGADAVLVAEGLLARYLLVLVQGFRDRFETVDEQVEHFLELAAH